VIGQFLTASSILLLLIVDYALRLRISIESAPLAGKQALCSAGFRDPIPESGHEQLWQNIKREKNIYIYYLRLFILTLMAAFGQTLLALKIYSARTYIIDFQR